MDEPVPQDSGGEFRVHMWTVLFAVFTFGTVFLVAFGSFFRRPPAPLADLAFGALLSFFLAALVSIPSAFVVEGLFRVFSPHDNYGTAPLALLAVGGTFVVVAFARLQLSNDFESASWWFLAGVTMGIIGFISDTRRKRCVRARVQERP